MIWVHNIDPVLIHIYKSLAIRWYPLAYILGFIVAFFWIRYLIKNEYLNLNKKELDDLIFYLFLGVLLGSRIFYMVFYQLELLLEKPLELFMVWHGGMSFHGGFIGILFFTYLYSKKFDKNLWSLYGALAVIAPVGLFFGRIANFINGELWGKPTNGEWGVIFPEAGPLPRHPSQLYEAFLEGLVLFLILFIIFKKTKKLKFLGPYFGMGYAIFRIIVEFFREPDRQLGYLIFKPLTMGQILSILMFLFSLYIFYKIKKRRNLNE